MILYINGMVLGSRRKLDDMPAFIEISYKNAETDFDLVMPNAEYWLAFIDPQTSENRVMRITCMSRDALTKVEIGSVEAGTEELGLVPCVSPVGLGNGEEEIWEISDIKNCPGLIAVMHSALLVSDFHCGIL